MTIDPPVSRRRSLSLRATLLRLGRAVNSVFGRLALLAVMLLVLIQATWTIVVARHQVEVEADHLGRLIQLASGTWGDANAIPPLSLRTRLADTLGIRFIESDPYHPPFGCPNACANTDGPFETAIRRHLPLQSIVALDKRRGEVWAHVGRASHWVVIPAVAPSAWRLTGANGATLIIALCIALLGAWQVERPLLRLARAARQLRTGQRPPPVRVEGPSELKALTRDFNEMARAIIDAEQERAVMLAGVAHDLRAPLTRIQVRAAMVDHDELQAGLLQDSASLSHIVTQFLDLARDVDDDSEAEWLQVDTFCESRYAAESDDKAEDRGNVDSYIDIGIDERIDQSTGSHRVTDLAREREPLILLSLDAGDGFTLPGIELDRILSNLIENAFAYGAPPLLIATARHHGSYVLSVTDQGTGMPPADFDRALRPFVRLDAARGGDAHCGLGLTIVRRLTRRYGGELSLSNAPAGGLCVTLTFPDVRRKTLHNGTRNLS